MSFAPDVKRLVDLVERAPTDDFFFPASSNETVFSRRWNPYHNVTPDITEISYKGAMEWGGRITVPLTRDEAGDLIQWICLRLQPRSWMPAHMDVALKGGSWEYADLSGAWMWAASLGSIAIQEVQLEINDTIVETWPGEWMDVWSRAWMDGGRAAVWDSDIYGQLPSTVIHDSGRPAWTTLQPTEDGYVYCWLPLAFMRRPQTAFPLVSLGDLQEMRLHITLRPFQDVVRMRSQPRTDPGETPLGKTITLLDKTGETPIPWNVKIPTHIPGFDDATVFAGVVHTENPLRSSYLRNPFEMLYEKVTHMEFDIPLLQSGPPGSIHQMLLPLKDFNGPIREICFFLRRKAVWRFNEWTNYGSLLEDALVAEDGQQRPLLTKAALQVGNATWLADSEEWWRVEYGLAHRGGVRLTDGMVYGYCFGAGARWSVEDHQPGGTVNASRANLRLDLTVTVPNTVAPGCDEDGREWTVHVFAVGLNWMRFQDGQAVPLFRD
jgi:hypothetical protein